MSTIAEKRISGHAAKLAVTGAFGELSLQFINHLKVRVKVLGNSLCK